MYVVLIGPPGCGKGTQSARLTELLKVPHLSTGEMLREMMQSDTPLGRRLSECVTQGKLVSDDLIMELVAERLGRPDCQEGCLFDGIPRNRAQAAALDGLLAEGGSEVSVVIEMQADEDELFRRIAQRAQVEGRQDDSEETLRKRIEVYGSETAPVLEFYRQQGKLRPVSALGSPDDVFQRLRGALGE